MKLRLLMIFVVVASVVGSWEPPLALASDSCASKQSNYFDGIETLNYPTALYGVQASVLADVGQLCTGGTGASAAWTMVADNYFNGSGGYAQSGYASETGHVTARFFSQYKKNSLAVATTVWGDDAVGFNTFLTDYHFNTGHLYMYVNSDVLDHTGFDPAGGGGWVGPWEGQYFGETWNPGDNMPGYPSAHVYFNTIEYLACHGCSWTGLPVVSNVLTGSSRYHWSGNKTQFQIWTDPLS